MAEPLRICYLAPANSLHSQRFAEHFAARGHEVSIVSLTASSIDFQPVYELGMPGSPAPGSGGAAAAGTAGLKDVRILRETARRIRLAAVSTLYARRARRLIAGLQPDVVHAQTLFWYGTLGMRTGRRPFIAGAWGSEVLTLPDEAAWYRRAIGRVLRYSDVVLSMAGHMTERLVALGAEPGRIVENAWGVDEETFNARERKPAAGLPGPRVLCNRSFKPVYDNGTVLRAVPLVLSELPEARFTFLGDGPEREDLMAESERLGIGEAVSFPGNLPLREMPERLRDADIYTSMSLSDGTSQSLLEAMACGAVPIVSDIPASREWVSDGVSGRLVPVGDAAALARAIVDSWRQPAFLARAAAAGEEVIKAKGTWSGNMARLEALYRELAGKAGP